MGLPDLFLYLCLLSDSFRLQTFDWQNYKWRQEIPDSKPQLKLLFKNSSANFSNKIIRFRYLPANSSSKYKRPKFISTQILGALRLQGLVYPYSQDTAGLNITM